MRPDVTYEGEAMSGLEPAYEHCKEQFSPRAEYSLASARQRQKY